MNDSFYICFAGLICHVGDTTKQYAAMVRDDHHSPCVSIAGDATFPIPNAARAVKFELDGQIVEGAATPSLKFLRYVPSLQRLMGGALRQPIAAYAIPVVYPPNTQLKALGLFTDMALYHRGGIVKGDGPHCVASVLGLRLKASADSELNVVWIDDHDGKHNVNPSALPAGSAILIHNRPCEGHESTNVHIRKYGNLLEDAENELTVERQAGCHGEIDALPSGWQEGWSEQIATLSADVECGNTNWP